MQMVGVRELKDHLTHYLSMIKRGENVVVTDRGNPIAILHSLDHTDVTAAPEEKLASLIPPHANFQDMKTLESAMFSDRTKNLNLCHYR